MSLPADRDDAPRRSLRIVHVWDGDYPTVDVRTGKVSAALTSAGHDVHIIARNRARRAPREELPEGTVHRMRPWRWAGRRLDDALGFPAFLNPRWLALLTGTVRRLRPDVILARDLPLCPAALAVGRSFGIPVVLDMAENYPAMMRDIWDAGRQGRLDWLLRNPAIVAAVERYCARRVSRIVVVIEESADRLVALGANPDRIDVVRNTPALSYARAHADRRPKPDEAPIELVYLGLLEMPRGIADLLAAVALLRGAAPPVRLKVIGFGRDSEILQAHARSLGLESEVEFLGFVPYQEAVRLLAAADIGVVPHWSGESWNTTIPNKLFDYMAAGLPVITSDAAPAARIVRETAAGEVFRSRDPRDLAAAVQRLFPAETRLACGRAGRRAILERYNWEQDSAVLVSAIERAAGPAALQADRGRGRGERASLGRLARHQISEV